MFPFNFVNYIFLLLCMFHSVYSVLLCCSVCCLCVNVYCTVLLSPGVISIAVKKYIIYHIIYHILYHISYIISGFGGLGVACWPLVPKFAGSNLAEAVGF